MKQQSQLLVQFRFILLQRKLAQSVEKLLFVEHSRHHDRLQSVLQGVGQFEELVWFHCARGEGQYVVPCVHLHHLPHMVHTYRELAVVRAVTFHLQVLHDDDLFVLEVVAAVVVEREVVENIPNFQSVLKAGRRASATRSHLDPLTGFFLSTSCSFCCSLWQSCTEHFYLIWFCL
jgi:hypothetical protein